MKKTNKAVIIALVLVTSILPVSIINAAEYNELNGEAIDLTEEQEEYGHSTVSVLLVESNAKNVSFEVPLYVTMAAVDGREDIITPSNYSITNTSANSVEDSEEEVYDIAVVGITFTKLAGATYSTVETQGTQYHDLMFSVGGLLMPAISRDLGEVSIDLDVTAKDSVFFSNNDYVAIPAYGNTELHIPLIATMSDIPTFEDNKNAVAQFKICYTVTALTTSGDPLAYVYAGDSKEEAGLE